jgi:hypothetical protein
MQSGSIVELLKNPAIRIRLTIVRRSTFGCGRHGAKSHFPYFSGTSRENHASMILSAQPNLPSRQRSASFFIVDYSGCGDDQVDWLFFRR